MLVEHLWTKTWVNECVAVLHRNMDWWMFPLAWLGLWSLLLDCVA
jgi:hypothetical protein